MSDRMAGGAFALAADPSLLAAEARHRGRLQHRSGAARGFRRIRAAFVERTASSAPTSPSRTRSARWRCRRRMSAPARSALPIRCGTTAASCARPTPTSKVSSSNLDAGAPGWDGADDALVLGAGGSSRAVVFGLLERGIKRMHLANRTHRPRARAGRSIRRRRSSRRLGCASAICCRAPASWSTPPRSACTASLRSRSTSAGCRRMPSSPISSMCRWRRRCWRRREARGLQHRRRARHAAAPGGARIRTVVRPAPAVTPELRALVEADLAKV